MLRDYQAPTLEESIDEALKEFMTKRKNSFADSNV